MIGEVAPGSIFRVILAGRDSSRPQRCGATTPTPREAVASGLRASSLPALAALALLPDASLAVRRPHGPVLTSPRPASTLTTSRVVFHWKSATNASGYDLRLARNRSFTLAVQTIHVRSASGGATLLKGAWYWKVRSRADDRLALVEHADAARAALEGPVRARRDPAPCASRASRAPRRVLSFVAGPRTTCASTAIACSRTHSRWPRRPRPRRP